jgi:hypothetical protein
MIEDDEKVLTTYIFFSIYTTTRINQGRNSIKKVIKHQVLISFQTGTVFSSNQLR